MSFFTVMHSMVLMNTHTVHSSLTQAYIFMPSIRTLHTCTQSITPILIIFRKHNVLFMFSLHPPFHTLIHHTFHQYSPTPPPGMQSTTLPHTHTPLLPYPSPGKQSTTLPHTHTPLLPYLSPRHAIHHPSTHTYTVTTLPLPRHAIHHPSTHTYTVTPLPLPPACNPPFHTLIHRYSPTPPPGMQSTTLPHTHTPLLPPPGMHTGTLAVSCGGSYSFDERIELSSRLLHTHSLILIWSFADPIHPQVITLHTHISYFTNTLHMYQVYLFT